VVEEFRFEDENEEGQLRRELRWELSFWREHEPGDDDDFLPDWVTRVPCLGSYTFTNTYITSLSTTTVL